MKDGFYVDHENDTLYARDQEGYWFTTADGRDLIVPQFVITAEAISRDNKTLYLPEEYLT